MSTTKVVRRSVVAAALFFGGVVGLGLATEPGTDTTRTPTWTTPLTHDNLQPSADMTQQMSTPGANGPMQNGELRDEQLDRSQQDPAFVRALEQHQEDLDRMLAR